MESAGRSLAIHLLGSFAVRVDGRLVPDDAWRGQKSRALVKLLALAPGARIARDQALDILWPDFAPEAAARNLYSTLTTVRKALAPAADVALRAGMLTLVPSGPLLIDTAAFVAAASVARGADAPEPYEAALALYTGDLLLDDRYDDWVVARREALRATYLDLLRGLAARHEARGDHQAAIAALARLVVADPVDEAAHAALMRLFALGGNRAAALRQYDTLRETLERELDAEPGAATRRLYGDIATGRFPEAGGTSSRAAATPRRQAGPVASSRPPHPQQWGPADFRLPLIGRDADVATVRTLLVAGSAARPVTLTGVGGAGKTRLALAVAAAVRGDFAAPPTLVELAPLPANEAGPTTSVAEAVAAAFGLRDRPGQEPAAALVDALRDRSALLVLDNCEHVIDAVAELVAALRAACPALRILATSREALRLPGEIAWPVPPLPLPVAFAVDGEAALAELGANPAVALFVEGARRRQPDFTLTHANARATVAICRQLAGLPLALELAAGRVGVLAVAQIAERLTDALGTLASRERGLPPRQQSLRAALDWSYDLLSPAERALFRGLAVFTGDWPLAAAEAVAGAGSDTLGLLEALIDKSLVLSEEHGDEARYRLLEPVRQYAAARLAQEPAGPGGEEAARERHVAWYLSLAETADAGLNGAQQGAWTARLNREDANLRVALGWLHQRGAAEAGLRLCNALHRHWYGQARHGEGRRWFSTFLALAESESAPPVDPTALAHALYHAGMFALERVEVATSMALGERALTSARASGDSVLAARALMLLGYGSRLAGDHAAARAHFVEALRIQRASGATREEAAALYGLGLAVLAQGDIEDGREHLQAAVALARAVGDLEYAAMIVAARGRMEREVERNSVAARSLLDEALALARDRELPTLAARCLVDLGGLAIERGDLRAAHAHLAEALPIFWESRMWIQLPHCLMTFAALAVAAGDAALALRLAGAVAAQEATMGLVQRPSRRAQIARDLAPARAALGEAASAAHYAAGQALTADEAVAAALAFTLS